mgnify:CR=1 FL=1
MQELQGGSRFVEEDAGKNVCILLIFCPITNFCILYLYFRVIVCEASIVVAAIFETDLWGLLENGDNAEILLLLSGEGGNTLPPDKKILFMHKNDYKWQGRAVTFGQL